MNIRKYLYNRSEKVLGTYIFTYTHFYIHVKLCMCYYTVYTFIVHSMEDGMMEDGSLFGACLCLEGVHTRIHRYFQVFFVLKRLFRLYDG